MIVPGVAGNGLVVTANVLAALEPQPLTAVTESIPPDAPAVTVIELVVDVPVQPDGNTHV